MDYTKNISIFSDYKHTDASFCCSVEDFCLNVVGNTVGADYREEVEAIRKETDKKARDKIKATLPAATISGTFKERRRSGLIEHSGFIAVDIDAKEHPHVTSWEQVRDHLAHVQNVFFSALSVSGRGVFLIVPIANTKKHEAHFDALKIDLKKLGYSIDRSCRDVSRLRGISYDTGAKINYQAKTYERTYAAPPVKVYKQQGDDLSALIEKIVHSGLDITNGYENWLEIGRALANEYGEAGRNYFHALSQGFEKYEPRECDKQFNACLRSPGRASKGTIFYLADQNGIRLK